MAANAGTKLHGKNGAIYITNSKEGGGQKIAAKAEWTLSLNRDYVDATVFGDTTKTYLVGLPDIQGTYSGMLDVDGDLMVANTFSDSVYLYLYADDATNTGSSKYLIAYGPALIDSSINASNTDAIRVTGNFRATTKSNAGWKVFGAAGLSPTL